MSEKVEAFELETISDKTTGVLAIKDFEATLETAKRIVAENPVPVIDNDEAKKEAKAFRATINKVVKAIDRRRIDTIADYTQDFADKCNQIKALLDDLQKGYGKAITDYEDSQKAVVADTAPAKKYTATIKFTDEKLIKKLTDFCLKNNCELTIK